MGSKRSFPASFFLCFSLSSRCEFTVKHTSYIDDSFAVLRITFICEIRFEVARLDAEMLVLHILHVLRKFPSSGRGNSTSYHSKIGARAPATRLQLPTSPPLTPANDPPITLAYIGPGCVGPACISGRISSPIVNNSTLTKQMFS